MQSRYLRRRLCSVTVLARCERTPCFYAGDNRCLRRSAARVQTLYHLRRRLCPVAVLARCETDATLSCWRQPLLAMLRCTCAVTISGSGFAPPPRSLATCCRHASMLASTTAPGAVLHVCSHHLRRRLRSVAVCSLDASCATRSCWRQPLLWWLSALFCNCFEPRRCCSNDASSFEGLLQNDETLYFCNCFQPRCCCNADERAPTQSACLRRRRPTLDVLTRCVGSRCKLRYASIRPLTTVVCGAMLHLSLSSPSAVLHRRACSM